MPHSPEATRSSPNPTPPRLPTGRAAPLPRRVVSERARFGGAAKAGRSRRAAALSVVLHGAIAVALVQLLTFGHGLSGFLGLGGPKEQRVERLTYVSPTPKPISPKPPEPAKRQVREPTAIPAAAPTATPFVETPAAATVPPAAPTPARADTGSGTGAATGGNGVGAIDPNLRGVLPGYTDSRVWRGSAGGGAAGPPSSRNGAERLDSIIAFSITSVADSLEAVARAEGKYGRKPGDWTKTGKNGEKWGWDNAGIRLGKVVIPNALLTLLPLNAQAALSGNSTAIDRERRLALSRNDIIRNADLALGDAEFRKIVNELRDRREKERRDRLRAPDASIVATKPVNK